MDIKYDADIIWKDYKDGYDRIDFEYKIKGGEVCLWLSMNDKKRLYNLLGRLLSTQIKDTNIARILQERHCVDDDMIK